MKDDTFLKEIIRDSLENELKDITFSDKSKMKIMEKALEERSLISKILDYEITIPLQPVVAVIAAFFIGIGYMVYPIVSVNEGDILSSKIEVVQLEARR